MFARLVVSSALFSSGLVAGLVPTPSIPDTTITPRPEAELLRRQDGNSYLGWISTGGGWWSRTCASGATYFTTSSMWRCCNASSGCKQSDLVVGCSSGSLIFRVPVTSGSSSSLSLFTRACTSYMTGSSASSYTLCGTYLMFQNDHDTSPLTQLACADSNVNWNYYRTAPAAPTSVGSTAPSPTAQSHHTPANPTSPSTLAPVPLAEQGKGNDSKAWIAGVIIGPIFGIALGILIAFLLLRRCRKNNTKNQQNVSGSVPPPVPTSSYYTPMTDQKDGFSTYAHQGPVAELPGADTSHLVAEQRQEMDGTPLHSPLSPEFGKEGMSMRAVEVSGDEKGAERVKGELEGNEAAMKGEKGEEKVSPEQTAKKE